jgi:hypothetical protein
MDAEHVMKITHLRDNLGWAYRQVVQTDAPIVVQRYGRRDVILVPAWLWKFYQELETGIKAGACPIGREKGESCPCSLSG